MNLANFVNFPEMLCFHGFMNLILALHLPSRRSVSYGRKFLHTTSKCIVYSFKPHTSKVNAKFQLKENRERLQVFQQYRLTYLVTFSEISCYPIYYTEGGDGHTLIS